MRCTEISVGDTYTTNTYQDGHKAACFIYLTNSESRNGQLIIKNLNTHETVRANATILDASDHRIGDFCREVHRLWHLYCH